MNGHLRAWLKVAFPFLLIALSDSAFGQRQLYTDEYTDDQLYKFFGQIVRKYKFESDEQIDFKLNPTPILSFTNPVRQSLRGNVHVWTEDGRPAVMVTMVTFNIRNGFMYRHSNSSLVEKPFHALLNDREVWSPRAAKVEWHDLEVQQPTDTIARRLIQFRTLARMFKGEKVELDNSIIELRMLTQPIFRYSAPKKDVIDGVIFAFAEATIPTIFLFIEAYQSEQGDAKFRWAACEQHFINLNLYLENNKVWSRPLDMVLQLSLESQKPHALEPYFTFFARDIIPKPDELNSIDEK